MSQKGFSRILKITVIAVGLLLFGILSALSLIFLVSEVDEISAIKVPWLAFIWSTAVPVIPALMYSWFTARDIGKGNLFCLNNARRLHGIALCAGADSLWVFIGNIIMLVQPGKSVMLVFIISFIVSCAGAVISICAEGVSRMFKKAAGLQKNG